MAYLGNTPQQKFTQRYYYTASNNQTTFSGSDNNGATLKYEDNRYVDVYLNGVKLLDTTDYTATSKTSIVLSSGAAANDSLEIYTQGIFTTADMVSSARGGTFYENVTFANNVTVTDTVSATHFDNVSDISLKENIYPIYPPHANKDVIHNLNPVSFVWRGTENKSYGLIAQEVEQILPSIVHSKQDGTKTVNYIEIIAFLIAAVQDLQNQIDDINSK